MHSITPQLILDTLADVVSEESVSGITIRGADVGFILTVSPEEKHTLPALEKACEKALQALDGVGKIHIIQTVHNEAPIPPQKGGAYEAPRERAVWNQTPVAGVKRIIAVASGKGGVGKSTVTVQLAKAMQAQGLRVGILDADIYGPSIPLMLGLKGAGKPDIVEGKMQPFTAGGIACMSVGFIMGDEAAILRGPMITKTLQQMLRMTNWGMLDVLLVDMPPGTGDVHLSLAQQVPLSGAVIVTTPQEVATIDARKCAQMFQKLNVTLLGIIENMSWFEDSAGVKQILFGEGGGAQLAKEFSMPLLAQIPLVHNIGNGLFESAAKQL